MTETPITPDVDPEEYQPDEDTAAVSESTGTVYEKDSEVGLTPHDEELRSEELRSEEP